MKALIRAPAARCRRDWSAANRSRTGRSHATSRTAGMCKVVQAAPGMLALADFRGRRFLGRGVRAGADVRRPAHACHRQRSQERDEQTKKACSLKHLVNFTPRTLHITLYITLMHAGCQRTVTGQNHSTALIVRELSHSWQRKNLDRWKHYFRFNPLWNKHIQRYYLRSDTFSNRLPGYCGGTSRVKSFS